MTEIARFLEQYKAHLTAEARTRWVTAKFARCIPTLFRAVRTEVGMSPVQFGNLLDLSGFMICAIEDGIVVPEAVTLQVLRMVLEEMEAEQHV